MPNTEEDPEDAKGEEEAAPKVLLDPNADVDPEGVPEEPPKIEDVEDWLVPAPPNNEDDCPPEPPNTELGC